MKAKKFISVALATILSLGFASSLAGCNIDRGNGGTSGGTNGGTIVGNEDVDGTKTQLYVRNYQGGFGNTWLYDGKAKLEEKYKDVSLESGKKGVQVMITDIKETPTDTNVKNDPYEVYFVEKVQYLYLQKQGVMEDITSVVTGESSYDGKTIESKLTDEQKAFYGIQENGATHYYALPHYMAPVGIVYDIDLFEEKGYYFIDGYEKETDNNARFIEFDNDKKSAGPDGKYNTADDGLPATYEDFWYLCKRIKDDGNTPLNWGGIKCAKYYVTAMMLQLMADYQGAEDFMKNFTMEGEMTELVKLDNNGNVVMKNGVPETETVELNGTNNGIESFRHISYYYALEFVKDMMDNIGTYTTTNAKDSTYDAFAAQKDYVVSRKYSGNGRQAMLVEGSWWENEASSYFAEANLKKENCNYGWMPLPQATSEQVGKHNRAMLNNINSLCFVKKGLSDVKKQLALDFVQLMNSDESLQNFTVRTNAFKNLSYDLTETQANGLSPFGKNLYSAWKNSDIINPEDNNEQFYNTVYQTDMSNRYKSTVGAYAAEQFIANKNLTAAEYFAGTYKQLKKDVSLWK